MIHPNFHRLCITACGLQPKYFDVSHNADNYTVHSLKQKVKEAFIELTRFRVNVLENAHGIDLPILIHKRCTVVFYAFHHSSVVR